MMFRARLGFLVSIVSTVCLACSGSDPVDATPPGGGDDAAGGADAAVADANATAGDTGVLEGDAGVVTTAADASAIPDAARLDAGGGMDASASRDATAGDAMPRADAGFCGTNPGCGPGETCRHGFCMPTTLPTWDLRLAPADFQRVVSNPDTEIFVDCQLVVGPTTYPNGRMRLRGGSSRYYDKKSFRIEFAEGAPHPGFTRKINLRAEWNDRSLMRNHLAHEMFRRFTRLPVPLTRYINLQVNGAEYGVMVEVERVAGSFLERNGRDRTRNTYEADPESEFHNMGGTTLIRLPDLPTYRGSFEQASGTTTDYADLRAFIETTIEGDSIQTGMSETSTTPRIRAAFDVDGFVDQLAVYAVIQSADHVKKNYFLSNQLGPGGRPRWEYYPWDLDLTFGCLYDATFDDTICRTLVVDLEPTIGLRGPVRPTYPTGSYFNELMHLVLSDPQLHDRYARRTCEILDSPFWQRDILELIRAIDETIMPFVDIDPNDRNTTRAEFVMAQEELRMFRAMRPPQLRQYLCP